MENIEEFRKEVVLKAPVSSGSFLHKQTGLEFSFFFVSEDEKGEYGQSSAFGDSYVFEVPEKQHVIFKMSDEEAIACTKNGNVFVCKKSPGMEETQTTFSHSSDEADLSEFNKWSRIYLTSLNKLEPEEPGVSLTTDEGKNTRKVRGEEEPQKCHFCGKLFRTFSDLTEHRRTVHTRRYTCKECGLVSSSLKRLTVHMRIHTGVKPFKCKYCDKSFATYLQLYNHNNTHVDRRPHLCEMCGKCFRTAFYLSIHYRRHRGEKPHKCPECDKAFVISSSLLYHRRRCHTQERPFLCDSCGSSFITNFVLKNHKKSCSKIKQAGTLCKICESVACKCPHAVRKRSRKTVSFELPFGAVELEGGRYRCTVCDKEFPGQSTISVHMRKHQVLLGRFSCLHCNHTFQSKVDRKAHVLESHTENRIFKCDRCDKSFFKIQHLRSHMVSIHNSEKAYKCAICSKSFAQPYNLEAHRLLHLGKKLYKCMKCTNLVAKNMGFGVGGRKLEMQCKECEGTEFELVRNVQTIRAFLEETENAEAKMIPMVAEDIEIKMISE